MLGSIYLALIDWLILNNLSTIIKWSTLKYSSTYIGEFS